MVALLGGLIESGVVMESGDSLTLPLGLEVPFKSQSPESASATVVRCVPLTQRHVVRLCSDVTYLKPRAS